MRKTEIEETTMTDINKMENGPMLNLYPDRCIFLNIYTTEYLPF